MDTNHTRVDNVYSNEESDYDNFLEKSESLRSHDYASVEAMKDSVDAFKISGDARRGFSGHNRATLSSHDKATLSGYDRATFSTQDKDALSGMEKVILSGPHPVAFSGIHEEPDNQKLPRYKKYRCFWVIFGVVLIALLLVSLALAIVGLWISSSSRADVAEFQESQSNFGMMESNPISSCFLAYILNPFSPSGYYWVRSSSGSAVRVYCDMTRSCGGISGGWRRVISLDFSNESILCPAGLIERDDATVRSCGIGDLFKSCVSVKLPSNSISYSRVCGRINAYQFGTVDAFANFGRGEIQSVEGNYVDGVSLTYGDFPRTHIWTFVAALDDYLPLTSSSCPCMSSNPEDFPVEFILPPAFIGQDYFCSTGAHIPASAATFYDSDPLWDGFGCPPSSMCCSFNNPPWFFKQLSEATIEDLEIRVCSDEERHTEDIALSLVEIYVQ